MNKAIDSDDLSTLLRLEKSGSPIKDCHLFYAGILGAMNIISHFRDNGYSLKPVLIGARCSDPDSGIYSRIKDLIDSSSSSARSYSLEQAITSDMLHGY